MSRNMITIMKKEFARFFGDKRMVLTTILLPGLMIYIMYSFMGQAMMSQFSTDKDYVHKIYVVNQPAFLDGMKESMEVHVLENDPVSIEDTKRLLEEQEIELLLVFPENFEAQAQAYESMTASEAPPEVEIYYNSVSTESYSAYNMLYGMLDQYESSLANKFDINADTNGDYDMATEKDSTAQIFSMMLPMLMMMFLFSGCMAIAPESIAGEKERGTIATLLVTPMKRSELAIGKIFSLSVIGLLSGISSFLGTMLALPKLMGAAASDGLKASVYSGMDYILLLLVVLSTVLVIIAVISIISGMAKSVKEASTAVTPLLLVVMVLGITSMFGEGAPKEVFKYLIPLYNSVQCMNGIFSFDIVVINIVVTVVSNLVYTLIMVAILAKIFDSEKIMYN